MAHAHDSLHAGTDGVLCSTLALMVSFVGYRGDHTNRTSL